jgi:hypothetical protein
VAPVGTSTELKFSVIYIRVLDVIRQCK